MERFKKIWFLFFMVLLSIPMIQNFTGWIKEKPLNGAFVPAVKPQFSVKAIWNETYQDSCTKYIEENIGFHNFLVRLNNQMIFSVFRESPVKGPVIGKDGVLFEESYIISYLGKTYIGDEQIVQNTKNLLAAQEILKEKGVSLLIVFPPGKASYYPELIPNKYKPSKKSVNNYEAYLKNFKEKGVNVIDLNSYIVGMKDTASYEVYCDLGAHWTIWAASIAMDSVIGYIEKMAGRDFADFSIVKMETPDTLRNQDDDLYKTMNLFFHPPYKKIAYPVFKFNNGEDKIRPKVLAISDSYWWTIYADNVAIPQNVFSNGGFWFYNKTVYPVRNPVQSVDELDYKKEIESQEFVLLVTTEATNHLFPYGFCEKYLITYEAEFLTRYGSDTLTKADSLYLDFRNSEIIKIIGEINSNEDWKNKIIKQAEEQKKDLDLMIWEDAEYTFKVKAGVIK
ncbi:MAG: hypothetical protein PHE56_02590 [Bacteroidales bacterium]|nr:hypothetical protein [Bacteroidales bacterium]